jgi:hypothetical protein
MATVLMWVGFFVDWFCLVGICLLIYYFWKHRDTDLHFSISLEAARPPKCKKPSEAPVKWYTSQGATAPIETVPPPGAENMSYHFLHAEGANGHDFQLIAQWDMLSAKWLCVGEEDHVTPEEMSRRGWEYLEPVEARPYSHCLD